MIRHSRPPRPTRQELRIQILSGLREAGKKHNEGRLNQEALGMLVRRAADAGYSFQEIKEISGIPMQDLLETERRN